MSIVIVLVSAMVSLCLILRKRVSHVILKVIDDKIQYSISRIEISESNLKRSQHDLDFYSSKDHDSRINDIISDAQARAKRIIQDAMKKSEKERELAIKLAEESTRAKFNEMILEREKRIRTQIENICCDYILANESNFCDRFLKKISS